MKRLFFALPALMLAGCFSKDDANCIISQQYVHKYGFNVSPEEWEQREADGTIVELLKSGVKVSRSYENGVLHGETSYSFPHSNVIEKLQVYDHDTLLKEMLYDGTGMPLKEELYEFDNRVVVTNWDDKGAPLSVEEYENGLLSEGKYFTPSHELEAQVVNGIGQRVRRERSGALAAREQISHGAVTCRTTFHSNGEIHTVAHYDGEQLHGEQLKFSANGMPLLRLEWSRGVLDGTKVVYRNGYKVAEIPYVNGERNGTEYHYDDLGHIVAQIDWKNDRKHGFSQILGEEGLSESEWYYKGESVTAYTFDVLTNRDEVVAELRAMSE